MVHDPENLNNVNGVLFPDIVAFRVSHHAIKKGYEFNVVKINKTRFIATCAHSECLLLEKQ